MYELEFFFVVMTVTVTHASSLHLDQDEEYSQLGLQDADIENNYHVITVDNFDNDQLDYEYL